MLSKKSLALFDEQIAVIRLWTLKFSIQEYPGGECVIRMRRLGTPTATESHTSKFWALRRAMRVVEKQAEMVCKKIEEEKRGQR